MLRVLVWMLVMMASGVQAEIASPVAASAPVVTPATAHAPTEEFRLKTETARAGTTDMASASVQMVLGLAGVLALIFGMAWLARRFNLNGAGTGANLRVLGALTLGTREKLVLVDVAGQQLLLGVTTQQISLLQRLESPAEVPAAVTASRPGGFAEKMQSLLKTGALHE